MASAKKKTTKKKVSRLVRMDFDKWLDKFCPVAASQDYSLEDHLHDEPPRVPKTRLWTIVEGDTATWIVPGYRFVNRVGYLVSEKPHGNENIEVKLWD